MAKKRTISAESLRPRRALKTLHYEMQGDWYRDPWGWPELDWLVSDGKEHLRQRLRSDGIRRVAKVDVPKENFGIRPAIVMDPVDRLIYQCLVDRYSLPLVGDLRPWVYGWRLPPKNPKGGKWSHNSIQDAEFRNTISFSSNLRTAALRTDVSSFFASIDLPSLCEAIGDRCGPGPLVERLFDLMRGWGGVAGRRGLAQRSTASAALANMFLQPLDDVLDGFLRDHNPPRAEISSRFGRRLGDVSLARWMDDVWIFSRQPADLRNLQVRMQAVLNEIGLDLNSAKTELLEGEEVAKAAKRIQHSAIDGELNHETEPGSTQLDELIEQILENPSESTRSSIKFATKRMRDHKHFNSVPGFVEAAARMPHAADNLGRLFRDSGMWRELPDWYVDHSASPWGEMRWSLAQLGTMFPSEVASKKRKRRLRRVQDFFLGQLAVAGDQLPLDALAAQRLAAWDGDSARDALRWAAKSSADPHTRRVLALAAANAGEQPRLIRRTLSEFEENQATLRMLEDRRFKVKVKRDFDGD